MPSINELRKAIKGIKSTRQITKAMKMISAMRLVRAQKAYRDSDSFNSTISRLAGCVLSKATAQVIRYVKPEPTGKSLLISIAADKGLCGSFNNSVILKTIKSAPDAVILIGKKAVDAAARMNCEVIGAYPNVFSELSFSQASLIAIKALECFDGGGFSKVTVIYNSFESMIRYKTIERTLLPVALSKSETKNIEFEPEPDKLFLSLLPLYVKSNIFKFLTESYYAELAARVSAMDNATKNADELIDIRTLDMNKVRQANITREIADIIGSRG